MSTEDLSVAEQRYQAMLAVISDGLSISQVAEKVSVSRQTLHTWLARYKAQGLEGLVYRSRRPVSRPHQMPAEVEAMLLELRRSRPYWGPRRLVFELAKRAVEPRLTEVGHDCQPGSERGSPNHGSTSLSKRVNARIRSPAAVRTSRPAPWRMPLGV
jgi:transposase